MIFVNRIGFIFLGMVLAVTVLTQDLQGEGVSFHADKNQIRKYLPPPMRVDLATGRSPVFPAPVGAAQRS
jgi:hypothetical protein